MKKFFSWASFCVIIAAIGSVSMYVGALAANFFVETFGLKDFWCLLGAIPLLIVSTAITMFFILGLQKFGGNE